MIRRTNHRSGSLPSSTGRGAAAQRSTGVRATPSASPNRRRDDDDGGYLGYLRAVDSCSDRGSDSYSGSGGGCDD